MAAVDQFEMKMDAQYMPYSMIYVYSKQIKY